MEISARCLEATFGLIGGEELECIEVVELFKYLGWVLDRLDDDLPAILPGIISYVNTSNFIPVFLVQFMRRDRNF